jgi:hypothetical protein
MFASIKMSLPPHTKMAKLLVSVSEFAEFLTKSSFNELSSIIEMVKNLTNLGCT